MVDEKLSAQVAELRGMSMNNERFCESKIDNDLTVLLKWLICIFKT